MSEQTPTCLQQSPWGTDPQRRRHRGMSSSHSHSETHERSVVQNDRNTKARTRNTPTLDTPSAHPSLPNVEHPHTAHRARTVKPHTHHTTTSDHIPTDDSQDDFVYNCANFRLRCDTIDERGGSKQRHDDVDKCADDLRHEMALEIWIVSVHEKSEQL